VSRIEKGVVVFLFAASVVTFLMAASCAHGLDGARQALTAAEKIQTDTILLIEKYDVERQADIVKAAPSLELGQRHLFDYRLKRDAVVKVVLDAAAITSVGETLLPLVEHGQKKQTDLDLWLKDLLTAGLKVREAVNEFKGAN